MILEFFRPQMWWILQVLGCVAVFFALIPGRIFGLCFKSYIIYIIIAVTMSSWMFLKSYQIAPSFFQAWFIGTAALALCGFFGNILYFKEAVSITNYIGAATAILSSCLLIL